MPLQKYPTFMKEKFFYAKHIEKSRRKGKNASFQYMWGFPLVFWIFLLSKLRDKKGIAFSIDPLLKISTTPTGTGVRG